MSKTFPNPIPPGAGHPKTAEPDDQRDRDHMDMELETNLKRKPPGGKRDTKEKE